MINFLQNLIDALSLGSLYALVALGIGLVFGVLRLVNFAHGDYITIGAYALIVPSTDVTARLFIGTWDWAAVISTICIIVVVVALITDALVYKRLRQATSPTLMIASFAVSFILQNGVLVVYGSRAKAVNLWPVLSTQISMGPLRFPMLQMVTIITTIVLMVALNAFLKFSPTGIRMRAAAEDFRMARLLGVKSSFVIGVAFGISGLLAAVVSLLYVSQSGALTYTMGVPLALFAFTAVVIGGMGSLVGAVVGGFVVGILITMLQAYLPPGVRDFRDAFAFGVLVLVLLVRPSGLVPSKTLITRV
ncbi:branched-chain amino acid ABC transporter permease [Paraburkholderia bannensis]|uniref:branched-chain amino acid ABC transporter permease n=1 Tax=Paraburkholderia bannensis TaxID=765414 RepID=UPI002AB62576|nr:branched-chain amino acid ABC transporter permease [Paraburkholderia bannensis]